jgi:hypothetical protein
MTGRNLMRLKHEAYRLHLLAFVLLLAALLAGAGCKSSSSKPAAQPESAAKPNQTPSSQTPSKRLIKTSGWNIPGLAGAKEIYPPRLLPAAGNVKVYSTLLNPPSRGASPNTLASLDTLKNYLSEDELKELGIITQNPYIEAIAKYDVDGHPFCYVIKYRSVYAIEGLHYYDEDGDKRFELLEPGTPSLGFVPRIPGWAQQLTSK